MVKDGLLVSVPWRVKGMLIVLRQRSTSGLLFSSLLVGAAVVGLPAIGCDAADPAATTPGDASASSPDTSATSTPDASATTENSGSADADSGTEAETTCTTTIAAGQGGSFVELCTLAEGSVQHVAIRGVLTPATHAVAQFLFGFDTPPDTSTTANANATYGADQLRVLLYGGGTPFPPGIIQPTYGTKVKPFPDDASFLRSLTTLCFDVGDGASGPRLALWVEGQKGANCSDKTTLTKDSAFGTRTDWDGAVGAIAKGKKVYFWQSAELTALPSITLSSRPALTDL